MTYFENIKNLTGSAQERFILKNLAMNTNKTIRKNKFDWSAYNKYSKYRFEFDDYDYFYEDNGDKVTFPRYLFVYKEKYGLPVKEILVSEIVENAYKTHKLLKWLVVEMIDYI